ncbi:MAG: 6-phosphogluconolactonase [Oscillospiraceae bacterium]
MNKSSTELIKSLMLKKFDTRKQLGITSAEDVYQTIKKLFEKKDTINMIFAAAPSQLDFIENFCCDKRIDFSRINAYHMDEYIGLPNEAPQGFGQFLKTYLFSKANFKSVNYINGNSDNLEAECDRYAELLKDNCPDIVCLGIGENGHIAFNDPDVAEFNDAKAVKVVELDAICRQQQVNDKCFNVIDEVPKKALTLTIPTLVHAEYHFCIVPSEKKAEAVYKTFHNAIDETCPATILRKCDNIIFYVDSDSGKLL